MPKPLASWREHQIRTFEPTELFNDVESGYRDSAEAAAQVGRIVVDLLNEIDRLRAARATRES